MQKTTQLIIFLALIIGGIFYWFEWRPTSIRKECSEWATVYSNTLLRDGSFMESQYQDKRNFNYKTCLTDKGLKE